MHLYATGDIHGDTYDLMWRVRNMDDELTEDDALICLGDVGIKYGYSEHPELVDYLSSLPCAVLVMRGNHDCRYWRDMLSGDLGEGRAEMVEWQGNDLLRDARYPNVMYLPDGGDLMTIDGHKCLAIPGAWSIDWRIRARQYLPFEPEEQLTKEERNRLLGLARQSDPEHVFSHTCPEEWMEDFEDLLLPDDYELECDNTMEDWMDDVLDVMGPSLEGWWFGHFHDDRDIVFGLGHLLYNDIKKVF